MVGQVRRRPRLAGASYAELAGRALDGWRAWNREWSEPPYHEVGFLVMRRRYLDDGLVR